MTVRLERVDGRFGIFLTQEEIAKLCLRENDSLELRVVEPGLVEVQAPLRPAIEYVSVDEAYAAYKQTEPGFAEAYRELAK